MGLICASVVLKGFRLSDAILALMRHAHSTLSCINWGKKQWHDLCKLQ